MESGEVAHGLLVPATVREKTLTKRENKLMTVLVRRTNLEKAFEEASGPGLERSMEQKISSVSIQHVRCIMN